MTDTITHSEYFVSIDIGIKNLAICIFERAPTKDGIIPIIHKWVVLNISTDTPDEETTKQKITKTKCSFCKHVAKFSICKNTEQILYCTKHAKASSEYILPTGEYTVPKIKKYKLADLVRVLGPLVKTSTPVPKTKKDWTTFYESIKLNPFDETETNNTPTCSEISLIDVSRFLTQKMDILIYPFLNNITTVLIENQISPIANRMKSVQSMITQYFVMRGPTIHIVYVSSSHKLDGVVVDSYAERKKAGIIKCSELLKDTPQWVSYMTKHKKKDDLCDCYLQGHWYINNTDSEIVH